MRTSARLGALVGATALTLALTACGSGSGHAGSMPGMDHGSSSASSSAPSSAPGSSSAAVDAQHGAADVSFAQGMIVHHRGAVAMAEMATTRASSPQVEDLAARIEAAQAPEIDQMSSWLRAWGEPVAADGPMAGMDHSSGTTGMSHEEVAELQAATGAAFDRRFLQLMTTHHQGAIAMARTEQAEGSNPQAIALARSIETAQAAEVTEMAQLLQGLP